MSICDYCLTHVRERYRLTGAQSLALINIPKRLLREMTLDRLNSVYSIAKDGASLCRDCKRLCDLNDAICSSAHRTNLPIYNFRVNEDTTVMKDVIEELDRRINIKRAYEDLLRARGAM